MFIYTIQNGLIQETANQLANLQDGLLLHTPQSKSRQISAVSWYIIISDFSL